MEGSDRRFREAADELNAKSTPLGATEDHALPHEHLSHERAQDRSENEFEVERRVDHLAEFEEGLQLGVDAAGGHGVV